MASKLQRLDMATLIRFLTPGRHVLAVLATPRSLSRIPWEMPLNVQSGQTYIFTATGGPSGNLVLASGF